MDYKYTLTAIPRDDVDNRLTKVRKVLPGVLKLHQMCRKEIPYDDIAQYVNWATTAAGDSFYEFDYIVVFSSHNENLGFAFVHQSQNRTELNVDMLCAQRVGNLVLKGVYYIAGFLNRGDAQITTVTLQSVPNSFGFYRKMGYKTLSSNPPQEAPLDKLWDLLSGKEKEKGKTHSVTDERLEKALVEFRHLDQMRSTSQSAEHRILRSLVKTKAEPDSDVAVAKVFKELLESYDEIVDIYDAIKDTLGALPSGQYGSPHIPMKIELTDSMINAPEYSKLMLDLKPFYDPDTDDLSDSTVAPPPPVLPSTMPPPVPPYTLPSPLAPPVSPPVSPAPPSPSKSGRNISQYTISGEKIETYPSVRQAAVAIGYNAGNTRPMLMSIRNGTTLRGFRWACDNHTNVMRDGRLVSKFSVDGEYIETFPSLGKAAESVGGHTMSLSRSIQTGRIYRGFRWANEGDTPTEEQERIYPISRTTRAVTQYSLDGQRIQTHRSPRRAAVAIGYDDSATSMVRNIKNGTPLRGFRWAYEGDALFVHQEDESAKRGKYTRVAQLTLDGQPVQMHRSMAKAAVSVGMSESSGKHVKRAIDEGKPLRGFRWAFEA